MEAEIRIIQIQHELEETQYTFDQLYAQYKSNNRLRQKYIELEKKAIESTLQRHIIQSKESKLRNEKLLNFCIDYALKEKFSQDYTLQNQLEYHLEIFKHELCRYRNPILVEAALKRPWNPIERIQANLRKSASNAKSEINSIPVDHMRIPCESEGIKSEVLISTIPSNETSVCHNFTNQNIQTALELSSTFEKTAPYHHKPSLDQKRTNTEKTNIDHTNSQLPAYPVKEGISHKINKASISKAEEYTSPVDEKLSIFNIPTHNIDPIPTNDTKHKNDTPIYEAKSIELPKSIMHNNQSTNQTPAQKTISNTQLGDKVFQGIHQKLNIMTLNKKLNPIQHHHIDHEENSTTNINSPKNIPQSTIDDLELCNIIKTF